MQLFGYPAASVFNKLSVSVLRRCVYACMYVCMQVVSLCWAHGLYNGILYIYNRAMQDYTTPLQQLLALLASAISTGKQLTYEQVLPLRILILADC